MKIAEVRKKTVDALQKQADKLREKIVEKQKAIRMGEENNHQTVKKLKRELAVTLTVISEKKAQEK